MDADCELMLQVKKGEVAAFNQILEKYQGPIINFVYRFVGSREKAEEIAQEVFLRIYLARGRYRVRAKFSTYIYRIAKNLSLNTLRKRKLRIISLNQPIPGKNGEIEREFADSSQISPAEVLAKKEAGARVKKALDSLPAPQKTAIILNRYNDLSYEEIGKVMNLSLPAVKSLLHRAKESLRKRLKGVNYTPPPHILPLKGGGKRWG
ncbi:MAG: RNA polymerase subunit sigma-24 [bacterium (Candidatus Ratteibacteria) CG01_land_8_20_14_3_00_40_19]|uniref:RNA polymerase sigma factor n=2 Tax=Candidatus Ratteibacteria TaxID=2979319 RepID=A0A2M7E7A3_9BACT|nr:MAG: RNA polymerase subunit sigma-24 [bacterium (Candidatus Ratteibacteria) CG01_land_8_20_14_3_00_40_19]